ncbi:MAG: transketolase [Candidatus Eisenbacteria bacterium]|uniref:Transketolase n=1 Tax=Eiseniibacteriota bacterium TaxID=2212470 RepID=A0A538STG7_UNCEI|nr:MAG: transketolase [Candidatus Eisenbacteria bacterium]
MTLQELKERALFVRRDIIALLARSQTGHSGGPLSSADFGTVLFFHEMNVNPGRLDDQGHPSKHDTPGIEVSSGSLGQGLSVSCGMALGSRMDRVDRRIYCIMGDGEQQEGQIWEAAMFAAHYKLDNLCAIIDYNRKQIDGDVQDVMGIAPLADKWRGFNWHVIEADGHDLAALVQAFEQARATKGKPSVILAHTVMGKGVSFMEDDYKWHGVPPSREQADQALREMGTTLDEWTTRLERFTGPEVAPGPRPAA